MAGVAQGGAEECVGGSDACSGIFPLSMLLTTGMPLSHSAELEHRPAASWAFKLSRGPREQHRASGAATSRGGLASAARRSRNDQSGLVLSKEESEW